MSGFAFVESGIVAFYQKTYERIFWDLDHAESELSGNRIDFANLIHCAAHLRLVLERVTTASFIASYSLFEEAQQSVTAAKDFGEVRKKLKRLNSHYWPVAFGEVAYQGRTGLGVMPDTGFQEEMLGKTWGDLSSLLHAPNPFKATPSDPEETLEMLSQLTSSLKLLLQSHIVQLAESNEFFYLRRLSRNEIRVQAIKTDSPLLK
ncbi:hypothetical protein FNY88_10950 [Corynebacterium guaraldiae]|uniref:AbiV family abortive infection protein n=1 Tax=Corynebacterium guaraldiae TaxID=3051103 RepID=A0ABY3CU70_9CORY|nr:hypothetical protein [Corynebacterium guaraldiae]TRX47091.1 hypothetical protein FNY88_10950 [Corynebacterium guaraldiae]